MSLTGLVLSLASGEDHVRTVERVGEVVAEAALALDGRVRRAEVRVEKPAAEW